MGWQLSGRDGMPCQLGQVILFPDGALLDLEPGEQSVAFPEGESHLLLAAVETGGEFTLETPADSGVTIWMPSD